jgi:RsiW-degrading membrane proteinase PrsW (M82 family)
MRQSARKIVGTVMLFVLVTVYALVATTIAVARLAESPWWVHLLYFLITGFLWIIPAMWILRFMLRPDREEDGITRR